MKKIDSNKTQIKENLLSTVRAIACDEELQIEFSDAVRNDFFAWDHKLVADKNLLLLPEILTTNNDNAKARAAADLAAAYLLFHDKKIRQQKERPADEQKIFDEFERARVICEIKKSYRGAAKNILEKLESNIFSGSSSLSLILLNEVFPKEILPRSQGFAFELQNNLSSQVVKEIRNLAKKTASQNDFELGLQRVLDMMKKEQEAQNQEEQGEKESQQSQDQDQKISGELQSFGQENVESDDKSFVQNDEEEEALQEVEKEQKIADMQESDEDGDISVKLDKQSVEDKKIEFKNPYKVYTTKFDEVVFPQKLVSKNDLELLRDQLDLKLAKLDGISKKMTTKLKKKLLSKRNAFVDLDASGGVLNRKKLTRLVIDPMIEDIWINRRDHEYQNTALTILLDNSGSMRGNPIVMSAMACEIIAGILEKFSIRTEVIGFTTADWKGGKARKLWESNNRPQNPGRLNELRHIVYKHFNQPFKKSRVNLGLMLKEGVLKENIDGEALLFARSRLAQRSEKRKILMVISDGTPVDDSTNSSNDKDILVDHLHHVINRIENESRGNSKIEIVGVGIGHSTEEFYRNSITIKNLEELGDVMIEKIADLL